VGQVWDDNDHTGGDEHPAVVRHKDMMAWVIQYPTPDAGRLIVIVIKGVLAKKGIQPQQFC
jgi:hypothetical protein